MNNLGHPLPVRLSGFAAAGLWHRRLGRITPAELPRPRVSAELIRRAVDLNSRREKGPHHAV